MNTRLTEDYLRDYRRLPESIRKKIKRVTDLLASDIRHPGIRAKKVINAPDVWEARIDLHVRMTFRIEGDTLVFRRIGNHDILKRP